ncbi:MAG: cytidine/deoxycytidylate deaminase family protein [Candidatus Micrarchaeaceae archaeon]|jgi:dCMP deaminase
MAESEESKYVRPSWDEYFLEVRAAVAKRATCDRGRSGCVIAKDKQIISTGYVGAPAGLPHCDEAGHLFKDTIHEDGHTSRHCVRTAHAEMNAITNAAKRGVSIDGGTLYCLMTPCRTCAMAIINSGIKRVVCVKKYHAGAESEEMFKDVGIKLEFIESSMQEYPDMELGQKDK